MENIPKEWQVSVENIFTDVPILFSEIAKKYNAKMTVRETAKVVIEGKTYKESSHYSSESQTIYMDENRDEDEYIETFRHEYGHFVDDVLGRISMTENYRYALEADKYWLDNSRIEGLYNFTTMLEELSISDVIHCRYVSDILSGIFLNDTKIRNVYDARGVPFYGHDTNQYWLAWDISGKIVEKETFANLYAIYLKGEKNTISFIEHWFPNITKRFKVELERSVY